MDPNCLSKMFLKDLSRWGKDNICLNGALRIKLN